MGANRTSPARSAAGVWEKLRPAPICTITRAFGHRSRRRLAIEAIDLTRDASLGLGRCHRATPHGQAAATNAAASAQQPIAQQQRSLSTAMALGGVAPGFADLTPASIGHRPSATMQHNAAAGDEPNCSLPRFRSPSQRAHSGSLTASFIT
jgi:hypothetical protein